MQALIQKVKIDQIVAGEVSLAWEVTNTSQAFEFFIDRSGSPEGPFETINAISIQNAYGYIDRTYNSETINRQVYYKIRGVSATETIESSIVKLDVEIPNHMGLAIARNKRLLLERFIGTKCFIFIRKTFGTKCSYCYDTARQKTITSNCPYCYSTTFIGGYFTPIVMYIHLNPLVKANQKTDLQHSENLRVDGVWASNFPVLTPGDLLVEANAPHNRYIIESPISKTELHGAAIEQRFPVNQIHLSRIEMNLPIPPTVFSINDVNVYRRDYV